MEEPFIAEDVKMEEVATVEGLEEMADWDEWEDRGQWEGCYFAGYPSGLPPDLEKELREFEDQLENMSTNDIKRMLDGWMGENSASEDTNAQALPEVGFPIYVQLQTPQESLPSASKLSIPTKAEHKRKHHKHKSKLKVQERPRADSAPVIIPITENEEVEITQVSSASHVALQPKSGSLLPRDKPSPLRKRSEKSQKKRH
jgi:hypothetical protein